MKKDMELKLEAISSEISEREFDDEKVIYSTLMERFKKPVVSIDEQSA